MTKDAILCGDELRRRREASGLALREPARMTGISVAYLSKVETVGHHLSLNHAYRLAVALRCDPMDFLGDRAAAIRDEVESRRESSIWRRSRRVDRMAALVAENDQLKARPAEFGVEA